MDPLITDPAICKAYGSYFGSYGCDFVYPNWLRTNFDPGSGRKFTYNVKCDPAYWKVETVDRHGAVLVMPVQKLGDRFTTGSTPASCVVRVWTYP